MGNVHLFCLFISFILLAFSDDLLLPVLAAKVPSCSSTDSKALLELKSTLASVSTRKKILTSWSASKTCCAWHGVTCNANGQVTGLKITDLGIEVDKPELLGPALSKLTELQVLILQNLQTGNGVDSLPLPSELKSLSKLTTISLISNHFGGSIPSEWSQISSLQNLNLSLNPLISGSIPLSFCNLKNLQTFSVASSNQFPNDQQGSLSGTIPSCFGSLPHLAALELQYNQITGSIASELGQLSNLTILHLSNNQLQGNIPNSLGNLKKLRVLRLEGNALSGILPQSLATLVNLQELRLGAGEDGNGNLQGLNKQLSGKYPFGIGARSSLRILRIRGTSVGGNLPASLGKGLLDVALDNNEFSGVIPPLIGEARELKTVTFANNHFQGGIPVSLSNLSLDNLDLSYNQLTGSIPADLGNTTFIYSLNLQNNKLSGEFPTSLWNMRTVRLSNNQLTNLPVSDDPYAAIGMSELYLDSNNLTGTIPTWTLRPTLIVNLANNKFDSLPAISDSVSMSSTTYFNVSNNILTGSIPSAFGNLNIDTLDLSFNKLTGRIPINFTLGSFFFSNLVLTHNQLSGPLPDQLFSSTFFASLDLSHNNLSGSIPDIFPNESSFLSSVDLSYNHLSGTIPPRLLNYSYYLTKLKLSHNEFNGPVPDIGPACQLGRFNFLALNDNKFTGILHAGSWLNDCATAMEVFDVSGNEISGTIPDLRSWKSLKVLNLARNQFTGKIPAFLLGGLPALQVLDVSRNKLTGVESWNNLGGWEAMKTSNGTSNDASLLQKGVYYHDGLVFDAVSITQSFTLTLSTTTAIDMSGNVITGQLASNLGSELKALSVLDVSNNKFSGALPAEMTSLRVLDVSNNAFKGKIPFSLQNFPASSFAGNPGLCGSPLPRKC